MIRFDPTRRSLARLLAGACLLAWPRLGGAQQLSDRGIGGTGVAPSADPDDRGIGGTGVVGTIRRFGSIVVNDLRITYPATASVTIDGRPAPATALKLGQVVRVLAIRRDDRLETQAIAVTSEVVGTIRHATHRQITVLGQTVALDELPRPHPWRAGDRVAVSGIRRPDGVVVASLVDAARHGGDRVVGPVQRDADGSLLIGALHLHDADADLIGQRVLVTGLERAGRFVATGLQPETAMLQSLAADSYSLEAFVERRGDQIVVGSGLPVRTDLTPPRAPDAGAFRAILSARLDPDGSFRVDSIRAETGASSKGMGQGTTMSHPGSPSGDPSRGLGGPSPGSSGGSPAGGSGAGPGGGGGPGPGGGSPRGGGGSGGPGGGRP